MMKIYLSLIVAIILWSYRLFKINSVGVLWDFRSYYVACQSIISGHPARDLIIQSTFGPPFVILPYFPFSFFPFPQAEYLLTTVNLLCFYMTVHLLWREYKGNITWFYWLFLGSLSFSFPLIFALARGSPMGIVTLGVYAIVLFRKVWIQWLLLMIAIVFKLFPIVLLPMMFFSVHSWKSVRLKGKNILIFFILSLVIAFLSYGIFPKEIWLAFWRQTHTIITSSAPDTSIYAQSFTSSMDRLGMNFAFIAFSHWLFIIFLALLLVYFFFQQKRQQTKSMRLQVLIASLGFVLLVHPVPWQYYYLVFLPFLMLMVQEKKWLSVIAFALISFNGAWVHSSGILQGFLNSSQFIGTLLLFLTITGGKFFHSSRKKYMKLTRRLDV